MGDIADAAADLYVRQVLRIAQLELEVRRLQFHLWQRCRCTECERDRQIAAMRAGQQ